MQIRQPSIRRSGRDGGQQTRGERVFADERRRTGFQHGSLEFRFGIAGQEDDSRFRHRAPDVAACVDAVDVRQVEIEQDDVWAEMLRCIDQVGTVTDRAYHVAVTGNQPLDGGDDADIVVGQQDSWS